MKKFKSLITEFSQESEVIHSWEGSFTGGYLGRIGIDDVEISSGQPLDKGEFLGKEVTIIIGDSESEVSKQELPVIPKHVADWITQYRKVFDLYPALRRLENNSLIWERIYKWYRMNTHKFVNAYLTGEYEVVEEPLYYALVKGHELVDVDGVYWIYDKNNDDVFISGLHPLDDNFLKAMSKNSWGELGINESNADFVEVKG